MDCPCGPYYRSKFCSICGNLRNQQGYNHANGTYSHLGRRSVASWHPACISAGCAASHPAARSRYGEQSQRRGRGTQQYARLARVDVSGGVLSSLALARGRASTPARKVERASRTAYQEVTSYTSLKKTWEFLRARTKRTSRNTAGIDGVSINDFAIDPKPELRRLSQSLDANEFKFSDLRPHLIQKTNGKDRLICVPTVRDRIVQRALLNFLTKKYLKRISNPISYGFIKFRTVQDAAKLACEYRQKLPWAFKTDITSFFDQIPRTRLKEAFSKIIRDRSLYPLLTASTACEIAPPSRSMAHRIAKLGIRKGLGVRQGMPLSPFFANLILDDFDHAITQHRYTAIRYADDLIFFASSEVECYSIHSFCREKLALLGLAIPDIGPDSKSQLYPPGVAAEFLGLGLCLQNGKYELRLMPKQIEKIRQGLFSLGSIKELLSRNITLATLAAQIQNRSSGYLNAYENCTNLDELEHIFSDLTQKTLRKIYTEGLKIDLHTLSPEARTFLGLG